MAIKFVTDSASDIKPYEAAQMGIKVIPLTVTFGSEEFKDAITLTNREFYERLVESDTLPTTSQVSPAEFAEVFAELTANGDTVIALILSSALSGTYQSACIAAEEFEGRVSVIDTENVCIGQRIIVQRALELERSGMTEAEIIACIEKEKKNVRLLALLETLEYLKKGGRISAATAFAGGLLSIKPVVEVKNGAVAMAGKARGSKNGSNLLRKLITDGNGVNYDMPYCVAYSGLTDVVLQKYIADSGDLWHTETRELPVSTVGCVIGTHVGPGAIAVAFFEKE